MTPTENQQETKMEKIANRCKQIEKRQKIDKNSKVNRKATDRKQKGN